MRNIPFEEKITAGVRTITPPGSPFELVQMVERLGGVRRNIKE